MAVLRNIFSKIKKGVQGVFFSKIKLGWWTTLWVSPDPAKIYPRPGFGKNLPEKTLRPLFLFLPKTTLPSHENYSMYLLYASYAN